MKLLDAGIQIARFDSDLLPVIEELNRDFLRQHQGVKRKRTTAETKDPVPLGEVGPNGYKIGYTENGDIVQIRIIPKPKTNSHRIFIML